MEVPTWVKGAVPIKTITIEIGFCVSDSFYYGPPNGFTEQQWCELREPLYQPLLQQYQGWILTQTLKPSVEELIKHYLDVIRISQKHQCKASKNYFWMRPIIYSPENIEITFPWYDTWRETKDFLDQIGTGECGCVFSDVDQGWEVDVYTTPEQLFLRESNLDNGEDKACIFCGRQDFIGQMLGFTSRWDTYDFLQREQAQPPYTTADLESDRTTLNTLLP